MEILDFKNSFVNIPFESLFIKVKSRCCPSAIMVSKGTRSVFFSFKFDRFDVSKIFLL